MLDPATIATGISIILGKYAIDQGGNLLKEVGPKALETAKEMYQATLDYFRQKKQEDELKKFEQNPEDPKAQGRFEGQVENAVQEDDELQAKLDQLLATYEKQAGDYIKEHGSITNINVKDGAVATGQNARAYGAGSVHVEGNAPGNIFTGSGNTINYGRTGFSESIDPSLEKLAAAPEKLQDNMLDYLSRGEIKTIIFKLNLNYDRLEGDSLDETIVNLITHCRRQNLVSALISYCHEANETVSWYE